MGEWSLAEYQEEHQSEGHKVEVGGTFYALPPEVPLSVGVAAEADDTAGAIAALFGEEHVSTIAPLMSRNAFADMIRNLYGTEVPESRASSTPSKRTGAKSRPTSATSTKA